MNEILIGLISGVAGVAAATIAARAQRPSRLRDIVDTSGVLAERLMKEIARLDEEIEESRKIERGLRLRISRLEAALRSNGVDPLTINGTT